MSELPEKGKRKLATLQIELTKLTDAKRSNQERINTTLAAINNNPESPDVANLEFEISRLMADQGKTASKLEHLSMLVGNIRQWLARDRGTLVDVKGPKLREKGETAFDAIDRCRLSIAKLGYELQDVKQAGLRLDAVREKCFAWVKAEADRCTPNIIADHKNFSITFGPRQTISNAGPDLHSFICFLDPGKMVDLLTKHMQTRDVPKLVLSTEERDKKMTEIKEQILRLEREEEAWIVKAEFDRDSFIPRRPNADPQAVLGIAIERAKAVEPTTKTAAA